MKYRGVVMVTAMHRKIRQFMADHPKATNLAFTALVGYIYVSDLLEPLAGGTGRSGP